MFYHHHDKTRTLLGITSRWLGTVLKIMQITNLQKLSPYQSHLEPNNEWRIRGIQRVFNPHRLHHRGLTGSDDQGGWSRACVRMDQKVMTFVVLVLVLGSHHPARVDFILHQLIIIYNDLRGQACHSTQQQVGTQPKTLGSLDQNGFVKFSLVVVRLGHVKHVVPQGSTNKVSEKWIQNEIDSSTKKCSLQQMGVTMIEHQGCWNLLKWTCPQRNACCNSWLKTRRPCFLKSMARIEKSPLRLDVFHKLSANLCTAQVASSDTARSIMICNPCAWLAHRMMMATAAPMRSRI